MSTPVLSNEPLRRMMTLDETAGMKVWGRVKLEFIYEPNGILTLELIEPSDLSRVWCAAETILRICRSTAVITADHMKGATKFYEKN